MTETEESLHFLDYWRIVKSRQEIVVAVALLVIITGVLVTYSMPKVYRASAVIQVKEGRPDLPVFDEREMMRYDPLFLRTQYEIIQSRPILEEAVRQCNLNEKLGKAYGYLDKLGPASFEHTVKLLSKNMKVKQYRETNLIAIDIYLSEPKANAWDEAADLANKVADIYREQNAERSRNATDRALKAIYDQLNTMEKKVADQRVKVDEIRKKYNITLMGPSTDSGVESARLETIGIARMDEQRIKVRLELEGKKARYDKIMSLSEKDLMDAVPYLVNDPSLLSLVQKKREAEVQRSSMLSEGSYGANHPDVVRIQATIHELEQKISEALKGLKNGVLADYEAAKTQFNTVEKMVEDERTDDIKSETSGYKDFEKAAEELQHAKKIRDTLELRYHEEKIELGIPRTTVEVIEPAKPPDKDDPVSPRFLLNIILSVLAGLTSGIGLAYFIEYLDTSVKTIEEVERYMHVPVLGVIPQKMKPFIEERGQGSHVEAYRVLRTNIRFSNKQKEIRTLCVTSGSVGEGKSLTLFNLAFVCAQLGDRVLLIDSDLHRPRQHKIFGISHSVGLANVLIGEVSIENAIMPTKVNNLDFLASGRLSSSVHGLLDTAKMDELITIFRENYDLVLFDAPPIIGVSDASLLVGKMDGVLLVVQHRKYPRSVSNRAKDMIQNVGANLLGVVLNNINISRDYSYYYHYYSYPQQQQAGKSANKPA